MNLDKTPVWSIIGAVIIGGSILAGSIILNGSLRDASDKLQGIQKSLVETKDELKVIAANRPASGSARRGPDPNKRYTVKTENAPAKGPLTAKVELIEFSDFQ
jgi:hypothetical protein